MKTQSISFIIDNVSASIPTGVQQKAERDSCTGFHCRLILKSGWARWIMARVFAGLTFLAVPAFRHSCIPSKVWDTL